jgi:hypothetical protein
VEGSGRVTLVTRHLEKTMFRKLTLAALLLGGPAHAQSCGSWIAEVWETEGGEAMTAHVCAPSDTGREPMIFVQCDGPEAYAVFYDDGGEGAPPGGDPDYTGDVTFSAGDTTLTQPMTYQGLDGTLYAAAPEGEVLDLLLRGGGELAIAPADAGLRAHSFTLEGAVDALDQILSDCAG